MCLIMPVYLYKQNCYTFYKNKNILDRYGNKVIQVLSKMNVEETTTEFVIWRLTDNGRM